MSQNPKNMWKQSLSIMVLILTTFFCRTVDQTGKSDFAPRESRAQTDITLRIPNSITEADDHVHCHHKRLDCLLQCAGTETR